MEEARTKAREESVKESKVAQEKAEREAPTEFQGGDRGQTAARLSDSTTGNPDVYSDEIICGGCGGDNAGLMG